MLHTKSSPSLRIIAVSVSLVEAPDPFSFDDSYRPVPLTTHVLSFGWIGKTSTWVKSLNKHIPEIVAK